jgi:hypothetical protein
VCRDWRRYADDPVVWQNVSVGHLPEIDEMTRSNCRNRCTQTDNTSGGSSASSSKLKLAEGLKQLSLRCFSRTQCLALPLLPADALEQILMCAPDLRRLHVYLSDEDLMSYNENGLVAIARSCRNLETLSHPLPPVHFDSDGKEQRSSRLAATKYINLGTKISHI